MRALTFFAVMALAVHLPANSADSLFTISDELSKSYIQAVLDPGVAIFWGDQVPPADLAVKSRPDKFSGLEFNVIPFAGTVQHCREAFRKSLKNMLGDARKMGYDVVYGVRSVVDGKPSNDLARFTCSQLVHVSTVKLEAELARTPAAAKRFAEMEVSALREASASARKPAAKSSYLPLAPILSSPEAQAILGTTMKWHVGSTSVPAYNLQLGPFEYEGEHDAGKSGEAGDCKKAVLQALESMVEEARDKGYSALTRIHSYFNEKRTPVDTDVECEVKGASAHVNLRTVFASTN